MTELSGFELGWLVGILEGEAYFGYCSQTQIIQVQMCDEDVVNKVAALFERITNSSIRVTEYDRGGTAQIAYKVHVSGERARAIMRLVVRHMNYRRRQKIWQALNGFVTTMHKVDLVRLLKIGEVA